MLNLSRTLPPILTLMLAGCSSSSLTNAEPLPTYSLPVTPVYGLLQPTGDSPRFTAFSLEPEYVKRQVTNGETWVALDDLKPVWQPKDRDATRRAIGLAIADQPSLAKHLEKIESINASLLSETRALRTEHLDRSLPKAQIRWQESFDWQTGGGSSFAESFGVNLAEELPRVRVRHNEIPDTFPSMSYSGSPIIANSESLVNVISVAARKTLARNEQLAKQALVECSTNSPAVLNLEFECPEQVPISQNNFNIGIAITSVTFRHLQPGSIAQTSNGISLRYAPGPDVWSIVNARDTAITLEELNVIVDTKTALVKFKESPSLDPGERYSFEMASEARKALGQTLFKVTPATLDERAALWRATLRFQADNTGMHNAHFDGEFTQADMLKSRAIDDSVD